MHFFPVPVRALGGLALGLVLAPVFAAESPHPLVGATRDQVLASQGEPKGIIAAGTRTVITYTKERFVLRNNVVVDVEQIFSDAARRPAPAPAPADNVPGATAAAPVPGSVSDDAPPATPGSQGKNGAPAATSPANGAPVEGGHTDAPPAAPAAPKPEPKVEIKMVRPPGSPPLPSSVKRPAPAPVVEPAPTVPEPVDETPVVPSGPPKPDPAIEAAKAAQAAKAAAEAAAQDKRAKSAQSARRRLDFADSATEDEGGGKTGLIIGIAAIAGLGGFLWWRRQQSLALVATSVASTPVRKSGPATAAPAAPGKVTPFPAAAPAAVKPAFTAEFLAQLDTNRFEELVAAYFVRTGVVATRANTGAASPVHLRLSWKGEPRPFACAHCIAQGPADIEARALHAFADAIAAENLRRGYVVTSGAFSSGAVKFAASKQIILLPADGLLEKIKGLPESARTELMQVLAAEKKAA